MGSLSAPLMDKTLEGVSPEDAGSASGIYTTASQVAGALGVALIGLLFSSVALSSGKLLSAFVCSMLVITVCSIGLLFTIQALRK
ncbi:hypothetical protein EPA93_13725 [Ktedonosporobacter rubrisoli]|uniref:MFS transporter n=1 Tax=Ktedonosporobacter rubrisoli TaxID=2509675 RepID=A0A4P6JP31_KTERU|nr:hypothetical protein [Ktedonosporobacter rubrisoli]QBD77005.1 hypothetical protein EPA93_13725 [Ktedonosporobacter rubrisoli]